MNDKPFFFLNKCISQILLISYLWSRFEIVGRNKELQKHLQPPINLNWCHRYLRSPLPFLF